MSKKPKPKPVEGPAILIADGIVTLVLEPKKEPLQFRASYRGWTEPGVFKEGEALVLRATRQGLTAHRLAAPAK